MRALIRLAAAALLGVAAALLVSCGSSGAGLIPAADAGPLQSDFEAVAQAAESGNGNCAATESALGKTEQDFLKLPATVDAGLRAELQKGIANLRRRARAMCIQPTPTATATTSAPPSTTPTLPKTGTTNTPTTTSTTPPATQTTQTTTTSPGSSGGTEAGSEAGGEAGAEHGGEHGAGGGQEHGDGEHGAGGEREHGDGGANVGGASPGGGQ